MVPRKGRHHWITGGYAGNCRLFVAQGPRMKRRIALLAAAAAMLTVLSALPAHAQGGVVGAGTASGTGCSGNFLLEGAHLGGSTWIFSVQFAGAGLLCTSGSTIALTQGAWNPATGGCVPSGSVTGSICVGAIPTTGEVRTVTVMFSGAVSSAWSGTAQVIRA